MRALGVRGGHGGRREEREGEVRREDRQRRQGRSEKIMGNLKEYLVCNERERSHDEQGQGTNGTRVEGKRVNGK